MNNKNAVAAIVAMGPGPFYLLTLWIIGNNGKPQTVSQLVNVIHGTQTPPTIRTNLARLTGLGLVAKTRPAGTWTTTQTARMLWTEEKNFFLLTSRNELIESDSNNDSNLIDKKKIFSSTGQVLDWFGIMDPVKSELLDLDPMDVLAVGINALAESMDNPRLDFRPGLVVHRLRNGQRGPLLVNPFRVSHGANCPCDSCRQWTNKPVLDPLQFCQDQTLDQIQNPPSMFEDFIQK